MRRTIGNVISFGAGVALVLLLVYALPARRIEQPLSFNHAKHIQAEWECANCHPYTDQQAFAGLPRAQDCVDCHDSEMEKYPDNQTMREATEQLCQLVEKGQDLPWVKVHRTAGHVYFSHRRHTEIGQLECQECHGNVEKRTEPFTRPLFPVAATKKMNWCLHCHEQKRVSTDCLACHH